MSVDRTKGRSTVRSTDVHRAVHVWQHSGPVDRPVDRTRELCSLYLGGRPGGRPDQRALLSVSGRSTGPESSAICIWAIDRAVDRTRESCSLYPGGRPDCPNGHKYDRWRSTGRSTVSLSGCQISLRLVFCLGYKYPISWGF